jgi:hypothetical protein
LQQAQQQQKLTFFGSPSLLLTLSVDKPGEMRSLAHKLNGSGGGFICPRIQQQQQWPWI